MLIYASTYFLPCPFPYSLSFSYQPTLTCETHTHAHTREKTNASRDLRAHLCTFFLPWMPVGFRIYEWIFSCFIFFFLYCFIAIRAVLWQFRTQVPLRLGEANVLLTFWTLFIYQNSIPLLNFESSLAK